MCEDMKWIIEAKKELKQLDKRIKKLKSVFIGNQLIDKFTYQLFKNQLKGMVLYREALNSRIYYKG